MSLPVILDAEALVGGWLREHDDIVALDARVAGRTPDSLTRPWVRVTQLDAPSLQNIEHAVDYTLQLDCYAGSEAMSDFRGQAEASLLARTTRAVLKALEGTVADGAVIGRVRVNIGPRNPDESFEPARESYPVLAELMMHPA